DPARDREAARSLAAAPALAREPVRPLLDDVAHPIERLDIVDEGRPSEQADLRGIGRLVARQAALALDALEHRRFLAADIGAGATPQMDARMLREPRRFELGDLGDEQFAALRVFIAQIDVDLRRFDRPGTDQHALEEAMRIGFEIDAILEGAGLALI